jgi:hypothetical protein
VWVQDVIMRRHLQIFVFAAAALLATLALAPATVAAQPPRPVGVSSMGPPAGVASRNRMRDHFRRHQSRRWGLSSHPGRHLGNGVPELDPRGAGAALILVAGGALVLTGRRRRPAI